MNFRRCADGAALRLCASGRTVAALVTAAALAAGLWAGAHARQAERPIDHHATVHNGQIIGSAFLIGRDLALTNAHVVEGLRPGALVTLVSRSDAPPARARVVGISRRMDLAVLRTPDGYLPAVAAVDASNRRGLAVRAAGVDATGGSGAGARLELGGSVLSPQENLAAYGPGLVIRMPGVRAGFSGGPVLDAEGRLVGMITAIRSSSGARAASGYAPVRPQVADEAYVLRAGEIRREARRLLAVAGE